MTSTTPSLFQRNAVWFSAASLSLWMFALMVGMSGAVHLLLLVPILLRPWRVAGAPPGAGKDHSGESPAGQVLDASSAEQPGSD